ncbi:MAG: CoA-binding protein [Candidatus Aenigmatarchaeota archaeon]
MSLEYFFNPQTVAIIGASHKPGKIGYTILDNFVNGGFQGKVYPVNPNTEPILNLKVYPSIKKVPDYIDLAVIAVKAEIVPKVLKECVEKKVKAVVIISSGFSEIGEKGKKLEEKLRKIIKNKSIRVIGPNVIGVYDSSTKTDTLFLSREKLKRPKEGGLSFISQSGAVGSTILDILAKENMGIAKFISYGNAIDVNEADLIEYLAKDEKTKVIAVYLEGIKADGKKFMEVVRKANKVKPIIFLKSGKSFRGIKAAASHTGVLAGSARIFSAALRQVRALEAKEWEEFFDACKVLNSQPLPKGKEVIIITNGGGFGVLATDEAEKLGLELKDLSKNLKEKLKKNFPEYVSFSNPLDLTGDATTERYKIALENCLKEFDGAIVIILFQVPTLDESIVDVVAEMQKFKKPIVCCTAGGKYTEKMMERLEEKGLPVFSSPERAVRSYNFLVRRFLQTKKR